jgi:hypothetical protein
MRREDAPMTEPLDSQVNLEALLDFPGYLRIRGGRSGLLWSSKGHPEISLADGPLAAALPALVFV